MAFIADVAVIKIGEISELNKKSDIESQYLFEKLGHTKQEISLFREKLSEAEKLGINTKDFDKIFQQLSQEIRTNRFESVNVLVSSYSAELDRLIAIKKNDDLQAIRALKDKILAKIKDYGAKGIDTTGLENKVIASISALIDNSNYQVAESELIEVEKKLDELLAEKIAADQKRLQKSTTPQIVTTPQPLNLENPISVYPGTTYQLKLVETPRGSFSISLVTIDLSNPTIKVITDTANDADCYDNCPTKPLASFVADNHGFAGINGSYFCPIDYSSCIGKTGSFDLPVKNTRLNKFINDRTLFWENRGMMCFGYDNKVTFFAETKNFSGNFPACIGNFPSLISNGRNILDDSKLDDKQRTAKINRGGIANKGATLYLIVAKAATVSDLAAIMESMGVDNGLNLDGGGSSALYYGSYKIGPGRNLPNAVIIANK